MFKFLRLQPDGLAAGTCHVCIRAIPNRYYVNQVVGISLSQVKTTNQEVKCQLSGRMQNDSIQYVWVSCFFSKFRRPLQVHLCFNHIQIVKSLLASQPTQTTDLS